MVLICVHDGCGNIACTAFATPNASDGISYDSGSTSILKRLVTAAKNSGYATKIVLSLGGWDGSNYFSQVMISVHRTAFVTACVNAVNTYDLDGACTYLDNSNCTLIIVFF